MKWTLISYSELKLPLPPYKSEYIVGVVQSEEGHRLFVQISKEFIKDISIGIIGDINIIEGPNGDINIFTPLSDIRKGDKLNRVALVTGSSRGIGLAIAKELAKNGINIIINNDSNVQDGNKAVDEIRDIGRKAIYIQCDISNYKQVENMIETIIKEFGGIDILINNAGIVLDKRLENMNIEQWEKVISINLTGTFNCCRSVIKYMQEKGKGKIVNISSIVGEIGTIGQSNYSASKGGVISFTKTIAKEYAKDGIIINAVAPGFIKTKMLENIPKGEMIKILDQIPLRRLGNPMEVAKLVCFLVSDDSNYITGQVININGGLYV